MSKFITVKKGKETKRIAFDDLANHPGWEPIGKVTIRTQHGEETVDVSEALRKESFQDVGYVSDEEIQHRQLKKAKELRHNDPMSEIQTVGEQAVGWATMGAADDMLEDLAVATGDYSGAVADRLEVNPVAGAVGAGLGSVVGALAPGLPGGLGVISKATPAGIASQLASKAAARTAVKSGVVTGGLVGGLVDGALFGAGGAYANAVLADDPFTAESIIADMGSNALYGGALGGALGMAAVGAGRLSARVRRAKQASSKVDELATTTAAIQEDIANAARSSMAQARTLPSGPSIVNTGKVVDDMSNLSTRIHEFNPVGANRKQLAKFFDDVKQFDVAATNIGVPPMQLSKASINAIDDATKQFPILGQPLKDESGRLTELGILMSDEFGIDISEITGSQTLETVAKVYAAAKLAKGVGAQTQVGKGVQSGLSGTAGKAFNAIDRRVGGVIGQMQRAVGGTKDAVAKGVGYFAKASGAPRKGTAPAASTILSKIRFDTEVGEKPKTVSKKSSKRTTEFMKRAAELKAAAENPARTKERIAKSLNLAQTIKPNLAAQIQRKAVERVMFLSGLVPKNPNPGHFGPDRWQPSNTEIDKFSRIVRAAEFPLAILDDMNSGKLTQEAVDTVKQLYPEIYYNIQVEILNNLDSIKKNSSYQDRIQLGILFQVPTDQVLQPEFIQRMQMNYAQREMEREQGGSGGQFSTPGNLQKSLTNQQTASQRVESK